MQPNLRKWFEVITQEVASNNSRAFEDVDLEEARKEITNLLSLDEGLLEGPDYYDS